MTETIERPEAERTLPGSSLTQSQVNVLRADIKYIVDAWFDLRIKLAKSGSSASDGMPRPASREPQLVLNEHVSDLMAEVSEWGWFLARVLIEEGDWTPPARHDGGTMLAAIAHQRLGHFTHHPDANLALAVCDDARALRVKVQRACYPDGYRTLDTRLPCEEFDTSDMGERIRCLGTYLVRPTKERTPGDLVCSVDRSHRIKPEVWEGGTWQGMRGVKVNEAAARKLYAALIG